MASIDNLTITISANANAAVKALEKLQQALEAVNTQLDRLDPSRMQTMANTTKTMSDSMATVNTNTKEAVKSFKDLGGQTGNLTKMNSSISGAQKFVQGLANSSKEASRSLREAGQSAESSGASGFGSLAKKLAQLVISVGSTSGALKIMGKVIQTYFRGLTAPITLAGRAIRKFGQSSNFASKTAKNLVKELTRVTKMLKLMVTRMALRAVIKEVGNGFKSLALHSEEFNQSVSGLMNGAKRLGYSFAAMVSPLINALAPAIVYVINLLIKLANVINQVFSALTGAGTWNKAKEFTDDWASDIKAANKQAKELKKTVLGFDELNQLQEKYTSGGDTSGNILDMFETVAIDKKWKDIADWLKQMWKIGDFYDLGKKLGEKLRDMLEAIPWEQIRKTANKLGRSLATLINGFVEVERLGYDIGKTIAQSVNTVFEFLNGFVHKLHWDSIGKFIGDTFNGFFENIDWELIKDTVVTGMAGLATALQNFIDTFNWDNISDFVINGVDTITSGIKSFIDGVDWEDLGVKIGDQLNKIMAGVDWKDVGEALGSVLESAIDWAYGLITTFSVDDAVKALSDFLEGICERVDSEKAGEALGTALHKLIEVIQKFWWNQHNRDLIKEEIFGFFRSIFNSMTANDFKFIESTVGALAVLGAIKGIFTKFGGQIAITVAVAIVGLEIGGWLGEALTHDPIYKEYPITMQIKWVVDNIPTSLDDLKDKVNEIYEAWHMMLTEAHAFIVFCTTLASGPMSTIVRIAGWMRDGTDAFLDSETYKKATEEAQSYQGQLESLISQYAQGTITQAEYNKKYEELAKAAKDAGEELGRANQKLGAQGWFDHDGAMAQSYSDYIEMTQKATGATKDFGKDAEDSFGKVSDNAGKAKTSTDNLSTSNNNLKANTDKLNKTISDANNAYKNYKTGMTNVVQYTPILNKSQQEIDDNLKALLGTNEEFDATNKVVWENFGLETANASVGFEGTVNDISLNMDDCAEDLKKQTSDISKAFSKDKWFFSGVADGLKKTFEEAKKGIKGIWNSIAEKLNGDHEIGGGKFRINLPRFAYGGFPPENGLFLANSSEMVGRFSNGKTAVANNAQIVEGISAGVYNAVSAAMASVNNNSSNGYIANTIVVDGEVIARTVTKAQERQNMRYSPSMG